MELQATEMQTNDFAYSHRLGSGLNRLILVCHLDDMPGGDARFYSCKIICGPQCLYAIRIVHMDLTHSGHFLITDFGWSCEMSEEKKPLEV
eukprot:TsM_000361600 transcript=TsM_000361600 gene=TsM_000361600